MLSSSLMAEMCTDSGNLMAIAQQVIQQQQKHQQQQQLQLQHHQQQQMSPIVAPFGLPSSWGGNHVFPFSDAGVFCDPFQTGPDSSSTVVVTEMMHEGGFGLSDFGSVLGRDEFDSDEWMESLIGGNSTVGEREEMIDDGQYEEFPVAGLVSDAFASCSSSSPGVNGVFGSDLRDGSSSVSCSFPTVEVQRWNALPPLPPPPPQRVDGGGVRMSPQPPRMVPESTAVLPVAGISPSVRSLLDCALLIDTDPDLAAKSLIRIRDSSSRHGEPTERIAFYFSEALHQRFSSSETLKQKSQSPSPEDFAFCYKTLNDVCPYTKFAHLTANQAILESTQTATKIHIIDFGIVQGVQWAALLQALATRPNGKPEKIRISGIPSPNHPESTTTSITATRNRLLSFAKLLDLDFDFVPILTPLHELTSSSFEIHHDESVAVNFMLQLHLLLSDTSDAVEKLLRLARSFSPQVVTLGEFDLNSNGIGFEQRLTNAVGFYSATFESLDQAMERNSVDRERVERVLLGRQIRWAVDVGKRRVRMEETDNWTVLMKRCGFKSVPHSHYALSQAKILLWNYNYSSRYGLLESSPGYLCLSWDDRPLLSVSSWK